MIYRARMYDGSVQTLAQKVFHHIRRQKLLKAGDRLGVAVSGGADSVALLRLLLELRHELGVVLSVVHFNHKLRGSDADADEQCVASLAQRYELELHSESGDVMAFAAQKRMGLEAAARELRYAYFWRLLREGGLNRIATAHTLDDQAETVLLRVARGVGTRGLAGIYPQLPAAGSPIPEGTQPAELNRRRGKDFPLSVAAPQFSAVNHPAASIVRPLLGIRRRELEAYLASLGQEWREDKSNRDLRHARNRVRHGILPRLERNLNPAVREALSETAELARGEEEYWAEEVARVLPQVLCTPESAGAVTSTLDINTLAELPLAVQRRVVRAVAESLGVRLEFRHVEETLDLASGCRAASEVMLPCGWMARRRKSRLLLERAPARATANYEYGLPVPGRVEVSETGTVFEAVLADSSAGYNPEHFFDPEFLGTELRVRNWRAGDRFWPAYTKAPKKIKELLQEQHVSGSERNLWPVVVRGEEIVWVRGFPAPARLRPRSQGVIVVREVVRRD